jgi:hypothetical protein
MIGRGILAGCKNLPSESVSHAAMASMSREETAIIPFFVRVIATFSKLKLSPGQGRV